MAQPLSHPLWQAFRSRGVGLAEVPGERTLSPTVFGDPLAEHHATRHHAGLFDFSFMGCWEVEGPGARALLERLQTRRLGAMTPGHVVYTLFLHDDGHVRIDATVWCLAPGRYLVFTGRRSDAAWIVPHAGADARIRERSDELAVIALQGPACVGLLATLVEDFPLADLAWFRFAQARIDGTPVTIGRLGYTGERGYEIIVPAAAAPRLWARLAALDGVRECGFRAADILRIEAGFILFANELAHAVVPDALGLGRLVDRYGRDFVGAGALRALGRAPLARKLVGLILEAPRRTAAPCDGPAAQITSRTHSPVLARDIALALVPAAQARSGDRVVTTCGHTARVARLPFYDPARILQRAR